MIFKGYRWWKREQPELSHRVATFLVLGYLVIFPLDVLLFSRAYVSSSANPALYAALLGAIHFLLFVLLVRLYSATTDRDAFFLAMLAFAGILAAAILTVDTFFLVMFFIFLFFAVATFVGMELRRGGRGATTTAILHPAQERKLARALTHRGGQRGGRRHHDRRHAVFLLPAIQRRLPGPHEHAAFADERIQRQRRTRADRRNQKESRRRDARKNRRAGGLFAIALARHRADNV